MEKEIKITTEIWMDSKKGRKTGKDQERKSKEKRKEKKKKKKLDR